MAHWIDPEIISPKESMLYKCKGLTVNDIEYTVSQCTLHKHGSISYYTCCHGIILFVHAYAEMGRS